MHVYHTEGLIGAACDSFIGLVAGAVFGYVKFVVLSNLGFELPVDTVAMERSPE